MPIPETKKTYAFGPYRLSPDTRRLQDASGRSIALRGKGFELLWYLIQHAGRLVEKDELMQAIWPGVVVEENNLNQAVSALRNALGDDAREPRYLATIKGRGYQFVGDVSALDTSDDATAPAPLRMRVVAVLAIALAAALIGGNWLLETDSNEVPPVPATSIIDRFADAQLALLTDAPGSHAEPALSATGQMIAYVSDADGTPQIWLRSLRHGEPIQITHSPLPAYSPSWISDDRILYVQTEPRQWSIYSVSILGETEPQLVVDGASSPHHAKNADAFTYTVGRNIWIARNNGRDREQVSGVPKGQGFARHNPAISPDGTQIAFVHADEGPLGNIWLIPATGGLARQLTTAEKDGGVASGPVWSGDGRYVVYSVNVGTDGSHLWRINVATGESAALTVGPGGAKEPSVSRDGSRMAYTAERPVWRMTRIDLATRESTTLFEGRTSIVLPVSSPDHTKIAFFGQDSSGMQLYSVDSDGRNLRQLTFDTPGQNALPAWAGDGRSILYYRGRSLYQLDPADGSDAQVFADFHWSSKNWLDAYGDRITYHKINRPTGEQSTVVRGLGEDAELALPVPIEAAQWSSDGSELLGFYRKTAEIFVCRSDASSCSSIDDGDGKPVIGARPIWSPDYSQIYYMRVLEDYNYPTLWRVNRDGTNREKIADMPGYEFANSAFDFAADGSIYYNHVDRSANEIWIATLDSEEDDPDPGPKTEL